MSSPAKQMASYFQLGRENDEPKLDKETPLNEVMNYLGFRITPTGQPCLSCEKLSAENAELKKENEDMKKRLRQIAQLLPTSTYAHSVGHAVTQDNNNGSSSCIAVADGKGNQEGSPSGNATVASGGSGILHDNNGASSGSIAASSEQENQEGSPSDNGALTSGSSGILHDKNGASCGTIAASSEQENQEGSPSGNGALPSGSSGILHDKNGASSGSIAETSGQESYEGSPSGNGALPSGSSGILHDKNGASSGSIAASSEQENLEDYSVGHAAVASGSGIQDNNKASSSNIAVAAGKGNDQGSTKSARVKRRNPSGELGQVIAVRKSERLKKRNIKYFDDEVEPESPAATTPATKTLKTKAPEKTSVIAPKKKRTVKLVSQDLWVDPRFCKIKLDPDVEIKEEPIELE